MKTALILAIGLCATSLAWGAAAQLSNDPRLTYKDAETGMTFRMEKDCQHMVAFRRDGSIAWRKFLFGVFPEHGYWGDRSSKAFAFEKANWGDLLTVFSAKLVKGGPPKQHFLEVLHSVHCCGEGYGVISEETGQFIPLGTN